MSLEGLRVGRVMAEGQISIGRHLISPRLFLADDRDSDSEVLPPGLALF